MANVQDLIKQLNNSAQIIRVRAALELGNAALALWQDIILVVPALANALGIPEKNNL